MGETLRPQDGKGKFFGWEALVVSDGLLCQQGEPRQACDLNEVKARKARTEFYETRVWWVDLM